MPDVDFTIMREKMVKEQIAGRGVTDEQVIRAFLKVSRHLFVASENRALAYGDFPLSIGHGQTISQPYIVALMTETLSISPGGKVLEIGTGSGYQTAILAEIAGSVFTVELIEDLQLGARQVLQEMGYRNIFYRTGDGKEGWPENAPYESILVAAGAREIPTALIGQLSEGGTMVIPVGAGPSQDLLVITKDGSGYREKTLGGCRFVPLL